MTRYALLALAFVAAPAVAAAPHYAAEPATTPAQSKLALRDTLWRCGESGCAATAASSSRPAIVCSVLAGKVGELRSFSVKGEALSAADLQKCNARAKKAAPELVQSAASQ